MGQRIATAASTATSGQFIALALGATLGAIPGAMVALDQSMRRPSLARLVMHSLQSVL